MHAIADEDNPILRQQADLEDIDLDFGRWPSARVMILR